MPVATDSRIDLGYEPFPRQQEFHRCPAKYRLFGGAAGPGKSLALLWEAIIQILEWESEGKAVDCLLLRRTYPELEDSLLKYWRRDIPWREIGATWNDSKHIGTFPAGSTLRFSYSQSEKDINRFQSAEFLFIGVDELTQFTLKQWQYLTSRNRCPVPGSFPNMAGATNPGNIGHKWVKHFWVDKIPPPGMEDPEVYDPNDYAFIPARVWDNPIYANDQSYLKTLRGLPPQLRKAFLEGDWNIFAGQYFDIFNVARHTRHPSDIERQLQPWFPRWIGADWGHVHPSVVLWHAQDGDRIITYRELSETRFGERQLGEKIAELSKGEKIQAFYLSPDAFHQRTSQATIAQQIGAGLAGSGIPEPALADDDRIGGARLLYQLLQSDLWTISTACPRLIECLPTLIHDEKNIEDVAKVNQEEGTIGDDAYDGARYGLVSRLGPATPPLGVRIDTQIAAWRADGRLVDPTSEMIRRAELQRKLSHGTKPLKFFRRKGPQ